MARRKQFYVWRTVDDVADPNDAEIKVKHIVHFASGGSYVGAFHGLAEVKKRIRTSNVPGIVYKLVPVMRVRAKKRRRR